MKKMLKNLCTIAVAAGLTLGIASVSHAADGLNYKNSCNSTEDIPAVGAVLVESGAPDGTAYLKAAESSTDWLLDKGDAPLNIAFEMIFSSKAVSGFCTWETDVMFTAESSGFSIRDGSGAKQGKVNTTLVYGDGAIRFSKPTSTKVCDAELNKWYHIELVGVYGMGESDAVMKITVSEYKEDGTLAVVGEVSYPGGKYNEVLRNDKAPTRFSINPGTCVDNVTAFEMPPVAMDITPSAETINMAAGEDKQFGTQLYADTEKTMPMPGAAVIYELWNADKTEYLISDTVTITPETGLLTVSAAADSQSFVIRAKCVDYPEIYDEISVNIEGKPMLQFIGAGFDETYSTLINLKFNQNYGNEGDITFAAVVYDNEGRLVDVYSKNVAYNDQTTGEMLVTLNEALPEGFNQETWTIKVFAWSKTIG